MAHVIQGSIMMSPQAAKKMVRLEEISDIELYRRILKKDPEVLASVLNFFL
jgi:hypothetical protein